MPYDAKAIANCFLDLAAAEKVPLTPMQVQKLVYFAHGFSLGLGRGPLAEEPVEAWRWGPVIKQLYHALVKFGSQPIQGRLNVLEMVRGPEGRLQLTNPEPRIAGQTEVERLDLAVVRRIWTLYGHLSGAALSNLTHSPGSPWEQVTRNIPGDPPPGLIIGNDIIEDYFRRQLRPQVDAGVAGGLKHG